MKIRVPVFACVAWMVLYAAAYPSAHAAVGDPLPIEEFSLFGFVTGEVAQLTQDVIGLGIEQALFQDQIATARRDLHRQWTDPAARKAAASHLAELLFQKDLMYALLPLSEGPNQGWESSKLFYQLSGQPLDGGISPHTQAAFLHWVVTIRGNLGVYGEEQLSPLKLADPALLMPALQKSQPAYRDYAQIRDADEAARFLPLPPERLAADGTAALKEQRVEAFNPFGWGVDHRQPFGAQLRRLAEQHQQMLQCVYGPVRIRSDGRERNAFPAKTFWYKTPPADIRNLRNLDQHPTLSGLQGGFAELGERGFEHCPATESQAATLHAANVATHPTTLARQAAKQQDSREIQSSCGDDAQCARAEMRRRAADPGGQ